MVRIQYKIQDGLEVLQHFTTRQWKFKSTKFCALLKELNPVDREIFFTDFEAIDDDKYMETTVLGARQYCLKEPLSSLPRCRRNLKMYVTLKALKPQVSLAQRYSTFFVRVPPDTISLQLVTPKVVGV
jgi:fatty acyl-CoA reductase